MIMDAFQPAGDIPTGCCVSNECGSIRHQSGTHFRYARRPLHHPSPLLCIAHAHINDSCIVCLQAVQQQQLSTTYRSKLLQEAASHRVQRCGRLSLGCRQRWRLGERCLLHLVVPYRLQRPVSMSLTVGHLAALLARGDGFNNGRHLLSRGVSLFIVRL